MSRRVTDGKLCWICSAVAPCLKWWTTKSRSTREDPTRIVPSSHALRGAGKVVRSSAMLRIITLLIDFDGVIPGGSFLLAILFGKPPPGVKHHPAALPHR